MILRGWLFSILLLSFFANCSSPDNSSGKPVVGPVTYESDADWSPNGNKIVFVRGTNPSHGIQGGIFFFHLEDSTTSMLIPGDFYISPSFSPDGKWIVFSNYVNLYKIKITGDSLVQLTFDYDGSPNFGCKWSPDGKKIAYQRSIGESRGVYILDLETMQSRKFETYYENPNWMPTGTTLAVYGVDSVYGTQIMEVDTIGNQIRCITKSVSTKYEFDISFATGMFCIPEQLNDGGYGQLWLTDYDGYWRKHLVHASSFFPSFSPDGQWIVYTYAADNDGSLWMIRVNGTDNHRITNYLKLKDNK